MASSEQNLIGKRVSLILSDSWDLVTEVGSAGLVATVSAQHKSKSNEALVLELEPPVVIKKVIFPVAIITPRYVGQSFEALCASNTLPVNVSFVAGDIGDPLSQLPRPNTVAAIGSVAMAAA